MRSATLVAAGGDYFCELGGGSGPPDISGLINGSADKGVTRKKTQLQKDYDAASQAYQAACDSYRASCSSQLQPNEEPATLTTQQQTDLSKLQADAETKKAKLRRLRRRPVPAKTQKTRSTRS